MDPVDMNGTNVTLTLGAPFIMVHEGCEIRFQFDTGDETELLLGAVPNNAVELNFEVEALRELVRQGSEVLHQMDALRTRRDTEQSTDSGVRVCDPPRT